VLRISSKPQIAEPATAAAAAGQAGVDIAGAPGRLARRGVRRGAVLHRVDREQSQQRLGHRRHALARYLACPLVRLAPRRHSFAIATMIINVAETCYPISVLAQAKI
jgi:hypothetical protein